MTQPKKRMQIFRFKDAPDYDDKMMPFIGIDETAIQGFAKLAQVAGPPGAAKTVMLFKEPGENGLSLSYAWFKSGYVLPRHSHDADCVYFIVAGSIRMGTQTLSKGDGIFIPANDAYAYDVGPDGVEILEFRNATRFHIHFKGNDEAYWQRQIDSKAEHAEAWADEVPPSERVVA